ncbi:DUF551 domain-containing protein [Escherichia coli]|uniref:DUF551 domain-containing protein n=1 Tax=Escherichia coli TaxID=562 RepID=UPI001FF2F9BC|nr:DUF551 domain-containing protein [Escherichia coli]
MNAITKERIKLFIKNPLDNGLTRGEQMELARIALASLEAEPVAWKVTFTQIDREYNTFTGMYSDKAEVERWVRLHKACNFRADITPLYAAPPAMVVPDEMDLLTCHLDGVTETYADGWNACRAAMLQAEPVSNSDELPLDYLQGHKDGLEWAAQLAEANHPQTGDWLYDDPIDLARAIRKGPDMPTVQGGNSPVTPDAWISCSERMPEDGQHVIILCDGAFVLYAQYRDGEFFDVVRNGEEFFETQSRNVTHWMPLPEPPQEAK